MEKLLSIAISPAAIRLLPGYVGFSDRTIPPDWFNWIGTKGLGNDSYNVRRIEVIAEEDEMNQLLRWNRNAFSAGYATQFICCADDVFLKVSELVEVDPELDLYVLDQHPDPSDPDEFSDLLTMLREPDPFFRAAWQAVRWGGGRPFEECAKVTPDQWFAYGEELNRWYREGWQRETASGPNLHIWNGALQLGADHFGKFENALVNFGGFQKFFPCPYMPCCGIGIRLDGTFETTGVIAADVDAKGNWIWDKAGAIRARLSREIVKQKPSHLRLRGAYLPASTGQGDAFADHRKVLGSVTSLSTRSTPADELKVIWEQSSDTEALELVLFWSSADVAELRILKPEGRELPSYLTSVVQELPHRRDEWSIERTPNGYVVPSMTRRILRSIVSQFKGGGSTAEQKFQDLGVWIC